MNYRDLLYRLFQYAFFGNAPSFCQPLRYPGIVEWLVGVSLPVLAIIDIAGAGTAGVIDEASMVTGLSANACRIVRSFRSPHLRNQRLADGKMIVLPEKKIGLLQSLKE